MAQAAHPIFGSTPIPRYVQLADLFRQRVAKGLWPSGSLLPSIEQLMSEFDVARVTVRQAVALLAEEGLVSPQRGRGTFVTGKTGPGRRLRVETTLGDLVTMYRGDQPDHATLIASARQTLTISTADVETAHLIGIAVNAPMAEVRRVLCDAEGTVIYLAEVGYRGDYIHLEMDLKP
jgi:DNA-binding GntR family transcriptional regulator